MSALPFPPNEARRLEALAAYRILDTAPERLFDDITMVASQICDTPIALVSLVDEHRQWFKSRVGLDASETPREQAFCAHTILSPDIMVVHDTQLDARFAANPLVTGDPHIRFYAGAPLVTPTGEELGSLCVIDRSPRELNSGQLSALEALSRQVVAVLELRRVSHVLATVLDTAHALGRLLPMCAWCNRVQNDDAYWQRVETFIESRIGAEFTHGICPECEIRAFSK